MFIFAKRRLREDTTAEEKNLGSFHALNFPFASAKWWDCLVLEVPVNFVEAAKLALMEKILGDAFHEVEISEINQLASATAGSHEIILDKTFLPGVTDNTAQVALESLGSALKIGDLTTVEELGFQVCSGLRVVLSLKEKIPDKLLQVSKASLENFSQKVFHNRLVERARIIWPGQGAEEKWWLGAVMEKTLPNPSARPSHELERIELQSLSAAEMESLSQAQLWALSRDEMLAITKHFSKLGRNPTRAELEVIAQTWSEHCKHKIFSASIEVRNDRAELDIPGRVESVFKTYIKGATSEIDAPFLESVFEDNAGVISINKNWFAAIKVETHNSPSALDPYGGALTGIVGVNRDILGVGLGAKPIANLDVFCVGPQDLDENTQIPSLLHHPRRILEGIRLGVEHGGNKSGIPTVTGALVFHPSYLGKPLVFCGTVGLMPAKKELVEKKILPGDRILMVGGRIGKDGIHGATFSSLELNEQSPLSAVQLGDPLTQRRVWDFLLEAQALKLYRAITDNGAGGLSSSVGELARFSNGARMDVSFAKVKYPGLLGHELLVSESQERMTVVVDPKNLLDFLDLAVRRGVEVSDLGEFTDSGRFEVLHSAAHGTEKIVDLDLDFLHEGVPTLQLKAHIPAVKPNSAPPLPWAKGGVSHSSAREKLTQISDEILKRLGDANSRERRSIVEQYDHEVQARTVRKPYGTRERGAPGDGACLLIDENTFEGIALGLGLKPELALHDPYLAAQYALDECVRNCIVAGGDPSHMALVDNFCWPDPMPAKHNPDAEEKLGALVSTCHALYAGAKALGMPFISGKDSMKNDFRFQENGREFKISVAPTVLLTAMAKVQDVRKVPRGQVSSHKPLKLVALRLGEFDFKLAKKFYGTLHEVLPFVETCHDVSDGGFALSLAEVFLGANVKAKLNLTKLSSLFDDVPCAFILGISEAHFVHCQKAFQSLQEKVGKVEFEVLGESQPLGLNREGRCLSLIWEETSFDLEISRLERAYFGKHASVLMTQARHDDVRPSTPVPAQVKRNYADRPKALVLMGDGINCHEESAKACESAYFQTEMMHVNDLLKNPNRLNKTDLFVLPGGFSFGDELGSGRVLAMKLLSGLGAHWTNYLAGKGLVLGICNGFQALCAMGVFGSEVGLLHNRQGHFINRWVRLKTEAESVFTQGINDLYLPVRHGEGRLFFSNLAQAQPALKYCEDVNGSQDQIAGLSAFDGRVLGLMPHPEAFWLTDLFPGDAEDANKYPLGTVLFQNAAKYFNQ